MCCEQITNSKTKIHNYDLKILENLKMKKYFDTSVYLMAVVE